MNYSKNQKILSFLTVIALLCTFTFRVPISQYVFYSAYADQLKYENLVSVLVNEDIYSWTKAKVKRYAKDIQDELWNTKVVIIPVPSDAVPFEIASLNEKLYFEWYDNLFQSKLVWTVLIWDLPIPSVYEWKDSSSTILPYTDFEDKWYVYSYNTKNYQKNQSAIWKIKPEIWHWIISPNTWDINEDVLKINDYFDKNHRFYTKDWFYSDLEMDSNEPYVFYFDSVREYNSLSYINYKAYQIYLENIEDLSYNRFSRELATQIQKDYLKYQDAELWESVKNLTWNNSNSNTTWLDFSKVPDIQTRYAIQKIIKKYPEIINETVIWEFQKEVYNAWRYNKTDWVVNVDLVPSLISSLDDLSEKIIKNANEDLEEQIDNLVKNWLSRKIPLFTSKTVTVIPWTNNWVSSDEPKKETYTNIIYWTVASNITSADQCSIYRGSTENGWKLVEANRWYNIAHLQPDLDILKNESQSHPSNSQKTYCLTPNPSVQGYFWGNTPLNLDSDKIQEEWKFVLKSNNLNSSLVPIFDIWGSVENTNPENIPSPSACFDNVSLRTNWQVPIITTTWGWDDSDTVTVYKDASAPLDWKYRSYEKDNWTCLVPDLVEKYSDTKFSTFANVNVAKSSCTVNTAYIYVDWVKKEIYAESEYCPTYNCWGWWEGDSDTCKPTVTKYENNFKAIPSIIEHKSPTIDELKEIIDAKITNAVPIDKNRYVDFVSALWNTVKIEYPFLYRLSLSDTEDVTYDSIKTEFKRVLDQKSSEINKIIRDEKLDLTWDYSYLKTWEYPQDNFDLYSYVLSRWASDITVWEDTKSVSYEDSVAFALYWSNLNSVPAKYKFVLQNYLTDQYKNSENYLLPANKKIYEIAYLKAIWDWESMYINIDPEDKWENPYSEEISKIGSAWALLQVPDDSSNSSNSSNSTSENEDVCFPPEWVDINEWFPAFRCWLKEVTKWIEVTPWMCWLSPESSKSTNEELSMCNVDENNNWIQDCLEKTKTLEFTWDERLFIWDSWDYTTRLLLDNWDLNYTDNETEITYNVEQIAVPSDYNKEFTIWNSEIIYQKDSELNNEAIIPRFINIPSWTTTVNSGYTTTNFTFWDEIADVTLSATARIKSNTPGNDKYIKSPRFTVKIRWDKLLISSSRITSESGNLTLSATKNTEVSEYDNLFLYSEKERTLSSDINYANSVSLSKDKLFIGLKSMSSNWVKYDLQYPINVKLYNWTDVIYNERITDISGYKAIKNIKKAGLYEIVITDDDNVTIREELNFAPSQIDKITLEPTTNTVEADWVTTQNAIIIKDRFDNIIAWNKYKVWVSISWDSMVIWEAGNVWEKKYDVDVIEWLKTFKLKSTKNLWKSNVEVSYTRQDWKVIIDSKDINVVKEIKFDFDFWNKIKVWWESYDFSVSTPNTPDFSGIAFLNIDSKYWTFNSTINITNWYWTWKFTTNTLAWKDISVVLKVAWVKWEKKSILEILPLPAVKLNMYIDNSMLEIGSGESTKARLELQDRYSNLVYNDSSSILRLEVLDQYKWIIKTNVEQVSVSSWKWEFEITSWKLPWTAYFKVYVDPSLSNNKYEVNWVEHSWYWVAIWKIENLFKLNWDTISDSYNSLYTTLIWGEYWDYSKKWYLAWDLIFNPKSKALAVTTVLNSWIEKESILNLYSNWNVEIPSTWDLSQYIDTSLEYSENDNLKINIVNKVNNNTIWSIDYDLENPDIQTCYTTFDDCITSNNNTNWVYVKPFWNNILDKWFFWIDAYDDENDLLFKVDKEGHIYSLATGVSISINNVNKEWYLSLIVRDSVWEKKAEIIILNNKNTIFTRDSSYLVWGKTVLNIPATQYSVYNNFIWDEEVYSVSYNDPYTTSESFSSFASQTPNGYEFYKKEWTGWQLGNQSLLAFSAWNNVWDSTKSYFSFWMVNIWDPVISIDKTKALTKVKQTSSDIRPFDSTIWKLIWRFDDLNSYKLFDYNNSWNKDIVVFDNSWWVFLYENFSWAYINRWKLANIYDSSSNNKYVVWDFFWDWYDDIIFLNDKNEIHLLNNDKKDFTRVNLTQKIVLSWSPLSISSFDMDNDSRDDVVILDDSWEINIFYSKPDSSDYSFEKLKVADWYALNVKWEVNSSNWAFYYDWLYQNEETKNVKTPEELWMDIKNIINDVYNNAWEEKWEWIEAVWLDDDVINKLIYYVFKYLYVDYEDPNANLYSQFWAAPKAINTELKNTYFMKSEYLKHIWVKYDKSYVDVNWWVLKSWDILRVNIILKSDSLKNNVALLEKYPKVFEKIKDFKVYVNWEEYNTFDAPTWNEEFDFMLKFPEIERNKEYIIQYELKTKPFEYWIIETWLFEWWEAWDDDFWDIIYRIDDTSCSTDWVVFRSTNIRSYEEWEFPLVCWNDNLPQELLDLSKDENNNWIPDNIENLEDSAKNIDNSGSAENDFIKYANEQLKTLWLDINWDWRANDENVDILWELDKINQKIDDISDESKKIVEWFGCWFGWWCISTPFNWAPLAPWNDPTFLWKPIWDWLKVEEWLPIFSFPTIWPVNVLWVPVPPFWPSNFSWAGWYFDWSTSQFRIFVTPTLTGWTWMAICTWINSVAWNIPSSSQAPLVTGWNCIVIATKKNLCSGNVEDWVDWLQTNAKFWFRPTVNNWNYSIFNSNCSVKSTEKQPQIPWEIVEEYLNSDNSNDLDIAEKLNDVFKDKEKNEYFTLFGNTKFTHSTTEPTLSTSFNSEDGFKFQDPEKVINTRISWFPTFVIWWVSAQVEEIVTKIFDFPRLIVILPDFDPLVDSFKWIWWDFEKIRSDIQWKSIEELNKLQPQIEEIESKMLDLEREWKKDSSEYYDLYRQKEALYVKKQWISASWSWSVSSVKAAYEAVSKLPLINIEEEEILVKLPYLSWAEIESYTNKFKEAKAQWIEEIDDKKVKWSALLLACDDMLDENDKKTCKEQYKSSISYLDNFDSLISQIDRNIEILESYKEIPKEVYKLLNKKEDRLYQILCNVEIIFWTVSWWIKENWEIFKKWVELYITVKAIIKTWQWFIDIFYWYEQQCKECKNERFDLISYSFESILPKIPVIKFPKWPDVIFDLHNIRAWISLTVPTFNIELESILLPELPKLYLPEVPSVNLELQIKIPEIWLLPEIEIPVLPDIPSLPSIRLPNLPPPPKLPALFNWIEVFLDLMKLLTSVMCILKFMPFVPEWRAWDQIAFLTETAGTIDLNFMFDLTIPEPAISYVDAIKISTFVNYEQNFDQFIIATRNFVDTKINTIWSNLTNELSGSVWDFDFRGVIPSEVKWTLELSEDWINTSVRDDKINNDNLKDKLKDLRLNDYSEKIDVAVNFWKDVWVQIERLKKLALWDDIDSKTVIDNLYKTFSSEKYSKDNKYEPIRKIWEEAKLYSYQKEDDYIDSLQEYNKEKFDYIKSIIENEREINKEQRNKIEKYLENYNSDRLISDLWTSTSRIKSYNEWLSKYNRISVDLDKSYDESLVKEGKKLATIMSNYKNDNILADTSNSYEVWAATTCPVSWEGDYNTVIKWVYVNKNNKNFRLFDYLDTYNWDTKIQTLDYDNDWDDDILYDLDWGLYLKENLEKQPTKNIIWYVEDTSLFSNFRQAFFPSVNWFNETVVESNYTNFAFDSLWKVWVSSYRFESEKIVDKFWYDDWIFENKLKKSFISDMFVDIPSITLYQDSFAQSGSIIRKNLSYLKYIWNNSWVEIETYSFDSVSEKLNAWIILSITPWTYIYTWWNSSKIVVKDWDGEKEYSIPSYSNIEFDENIEIVWISWQAYIKSNNTKIYKDSDISKLYSMPLLAGTKIYSKNSENNSNIEIILYDEDKKDFSFENIYEYELYDLWLNSENYNVRFAVDNDNYYSKIYAYNKDIKWIYSWQKLLSPQIQADKSAPDILLSRIDVPVYNTKIVNLEDSLYDDSWAWNIPDIYIDTNLEVDDSYDWDVENDRNVIIWTSNDWFELYKDWYKIKLKVWPFDNIFEKTIKLYAIDTNWNISRRDVIVSSYAPIPNINSYDTSINWQLNSTVEWEPITLFRVRNGSIVKINPSWEEIISWKEWVFNYENDKQLWAYIYSWDKKIAFVNEKTWYIKFESWYSYDENTKVLPTWHLQNDSSYPLIIIKAGVSEIYKQHISTPDEWSTTIVTDFANISEKTWVFIQNLKQDNISTYTIPLSAPVNPWATILYLMWDTEKKPLFTIFRDWKIILWDEKSSLKLSSYDEKIVYDLIYSWVIIWKTLVKPSSNSIIK